MTFRVAFTDPHLHTFRHDLVCRLQDCGAELDIRRCVTEEDVIAFCKDADAIIMTAAPFSARVIESLTHCRIIARTGIGVDAIDTRAAAAAGIPVTNVPGFCTDDVADHAMGLILACVRKVAFLDRNVRRGRWEPNDALPARRLAGQCLGLVGFGAIGQAVAARGVAFGMTVAFHDPFLPAVPETSSTRRCATLDDLLALADVVSLHLPLNPHTLGLMGEAQFAAMKRTAVLINTARGGLVVEADLVRALKESRIAAAGLDVLNVEPPPPDHPLLAMDNVVITPHCAAYTVDALEELHARVVEEVIRALRNEPLRNEVLSL